MEKSEAQIGERIFAGSSITIKERKGRDKGEKFREKAMNYRGTIDAERRHE